MARLELEVGTDVLLLETGDALLLEILDLTLSDSVAIADSISKAIGKPLADSVAMADALIIVKNALYQLYPTAKIYTYTGEFWQLRGKPSSIPE